VLCNVEESWGGEERRRRVFRSSFCFLPAPFGPAEFLAPTLVCDYKHKTTTSS